jgi:hypothetical protein
MLQDLPQELHELITDNLSAFDYFSYRNSLGLVSGPYRGRKVDVQGEFRKEIENSGMIKYFINIDEDSLKINWKVLALLLGTKRIDLSEVCEHEQFDEVEDSDEDEDEDHSFGIVLGKAAVRSKRWNIARLLLNEQWEGDQEDLSKLLAYCMSSEEHISLQFIESLVGDERVDPSAEDNGAIRRASKYGHHECVALLLADERVDPSAANNVAIRVASLNGHHECVALLLADERVDPSAKNNEAIRWASSKGHHECVTLLLADERVDPSAENNYAIRVASANGYHECVALLLADDRVDPSAANNVAIRVASLNGHHECVALLLADERVDPSASVNLAIREASKNGHPECVALLWADPRVQERGVDESTRKQIRLILAKSNS